MKHSRRTFLGALGGLPAVAALGQQASDTPTRKLGDAHETLLQEMETKGRNMLSVPRKDGEFLRLLIQATKARNVLEIGTSQGYSTFWIALGLKATGGKLTTIEILPERHELAKKNMAQAGLAELISFKLGDAHKMVPTLESKFDFVFIDADKQGLVDYFNKLFPEKLAGQALLVAHNAIVLKDMMEDYLKLIHNHPAFQTVIISLTMDDGFAVSFTSGER